MSQTTEELVQQAFAKYAASVNLPKSLDGTYGEKGIDSMTAAHWTTFREALSHRPEGEAVAWQFFQDGKWYEGKAGHNRENMSANGLPVRDLYVAPPDTVPLSELEKAKADCDRYMFAAMHCKVILPDGNTCHSKEQFDKAMQEHQT